MTPGRKTGRWQAGRGGSGKLAAASASEQGENRRRRRSPRLPLFLVLDVLDDLGHVVLVFAELGGVLDHLFLFFLLALGRGIALRRDFIAFLGLGLDLLGRDIG